MSLQTPHEMLASDAFSTWLGVEILEVNPAKCTIKAEIREGFTNGFKVSHGGILFSLCDSAVAFAANTHDRVALSTQNSIHYVKAVKASDIITVTAKEISRSNKLGTYLAEAFNQHNELVAYFNGSVYFTSNKHTS